jgi:hypothetical protein
MPVKKEKYQEDLNAYCYMKGANLKRLRTTEFQGEGG